MNSPITWMAVLGICLLPILTSAAFSSGASSLEKPQVVLETSEGVIVLELDPEKAPKTVENFLKYVDKGHYNDTVFHRVISGFMIQGGGFDTKLEEKNTDAPVVNESKAKNPNALANKRGTIAMARTPDPDSATAQFFINHADNPALDDARSGGYTVFGTVISGMDVVDKIAATKTGVKSLAMLPDKAASKRISQPSRDVPVTNIVIKSAKRK